MTVTPRDSAMCHRVLEIDAEIVMVRGTFLPDKPTRGAALERAAFAVVRGASDKNRNGDAQLKAALAVYPDDAVVKSIITKAAVTIGTTSTAGWAAEVVPTNVVAEFMASLAPISAAARLIEQGPVATVPPAVAGHTGFAVGVIVPTRTGQPPAGMTPWTAEGDPLPVRSFTLNGDTVLAPRKFGFVTAFTLEIARRAGAEAAIRTLMREDAAAALDVAYFSATAASASVHPGLRDGVSAITGFAGGDQLAMQTDLVALSDAVSAAGSGQVVFVVSPKRAARIPLLWPDLQATFWPSLAVADDDIIAVDPLSVIHGFGTDVDLYASEDAAFHMSDEPLEIVSETGPTTADPVRSMYQTACLALRLLADVAFAKRRTGAVAWVDGATW